jgi:hypothetical protein
MSFSGYFSFFIQTYPAIHAFISYCLSINILLFILSYPFISSYLSTYILLFIHIYPAIYPFYPIDIQHLYPFISLLYPDIDPAGYSIWFLAFPACHGAQLDRDLLLHVLHIDGVSYCVSFPRPMLGGGGGGDVPG